MMTMLKGKSRLLLIAISIASSGSLHMGYQATSVNPSEHVFQEFVNQSYYDHYGYYLTPESFSIVWAILTGLSLFGDFVGMILLVTISERLGRRRGLYLSTGLLFVAYIVEASSKWMGSFEVFGAGRFLRGISQGWAVDIQSMFFSEISPIEYRGMCGGITEVFVQLGLIAGGLLSLPELFGTRDLWPLLFLIECVPTILTWTVLSFVHESPKYLVAKGHRDRARESLQFYQHESVEDSLQQIIDEVSHQDKPPSVLQLFRESHLRRGWFIGALVWFISTFSGNITIDFFSTHLLVDVGLSERTARIITIALSFQSLVAALLASVVIDHVGRRPLVLCTAGGLVTANVLLMTFTLLYSKFRLAWFGYLCVVAQFLLLFMYGVGPAVLQWTVMAEVVPQNARSTAMAISNGANIFLATVNQVAFFPLDDVIGGWSFLLYVLPLTVFTIVAYRVFPETNRKATSSIVDEFKRDRRPSMQPMTTILANPPPPFAVR